MAINETSQFEENSPLGRIQDYFNALQNSTDDYIFVVDAETNQFLLSDNFLSDFNFSSNLVDDFETLLLPFIYSDDRDVYEEAMQVVSSESRLDSVSCEFRLLNPEGEYGWVNLRMTLSADEFEQPQFITGLISRLDKIVKADYVTGLLNRNVFYDDLQEELKNPDAHGVVVVVGLDNIHVINETYGHKFGDATLRQIAQNITNVLPPDIKLYKINSSIPATRQIILL
mgnify:FL=1